MGDRLVRMAYLDESGTGDPAREPHVVVAAIILHADRQWRAIGEYLADMALEYVPKDKVHLFKGFHASELFSGGSVFERVPGEFGTWWHVLDELLKIPEKFDLPIMFGSVDRAHFLPGGEAFASAAASKINPIVAAQMTAFSAAAYGVEFYMRNATGTDGEVVEMIMENNSDTRDYIKVMQRMLADKGQRDLFLNDNLKVLFDVSRIMWPVRFEEKGDETSPLQIVDACAWAIRRRLAGDPDSDRFYKLIEANTINTPKNGLPEVRVRKPRAAV